MKLSTSLFVMGAALIAWDLLGHACCAAARTWQWAAVIWNTHSSKVWPVIHDSRAYDIFWTALFTLALLLMGAGYVLKK